MSPCAPTDVGSSYKWTSPTTGTVTLAFQFRNDPDYWYLDDVSVYDGGTQMLVNGDFETGSLSPWVRTFPNGTCPGVPGKICSTNSYNGNYNYCDGCNTIPDQLSQSFMATTGHVYVVSFWLATGALGSVTSIDVTLQ
jgi:hypothetical protein